MSWAIGEAAKQDTVIEAVTVWQSPYGFGDTMEGAHPDESRIEKGARDRLEETIADAAGDSPTVTIEPVVLEGDTALVLCHRSVGADLLVMGSLGHSPFSDVALGSAVTRCALHSPSPVVIVPKDQELPGTGAK